MPSLTVSRPDRLGPTSVLLDGQEINRALRGMTIGLDGHKPTQVVLTLALPAVDQLDMVDADIVVETGVAAVLERLGWTPPPRAQNANKAQDAPVDAESQA